MKGKHLTKKNMKTEDGFDVVIVGGGAAGLSAAMLLGRCMRKVLVLDSSERERAYSPSTCGFIGHDGLMASGFLDAGRRELEKFETVKLAKACVMDIERPGFGYRVHCENGVTFPAKAVLLAMDFGVRIPDLPGAERFCGRSLFQCPPCFEAWEFRGGRLGVLGADNSAIDLAIKLQHWSADVTLFPDGGEFPGLRAGKRLERSRIKVVPGVVSSLEGTEGQLRSIRMDDGSSVACDALYYSLPEEQGPLLAWHIQPGMGRITSAVTHGLIGSSGLEGLFVVERSCSTGDFAILAAAEGVKAAEAVHTWLSEAERSYLTLEYSPR